MSQALTALLGAAVTVAGCYCLGALLIRALGAVLTSQERPPLAFLLGAACLHLAIFALLALKLAYWPVVVAVTALPILGVPWGGAMRCLRRGRQRMAPPHKSWQALFFRGTLALAFGAFTLLAFFHAWAPESSADGAGYHLGLVSQYFRAHGFVRLNANMFASLGGGMEMLFLPAFIIGRHSAAALVHFAFAIALTLAMFAYGRRIGKPWIGAAAAFLTFTSPVVGIDASSAYNDVAVAAVAFSVFYWLEIWEEHRDARLLIPIGLLAGYAYAIKYTAFVMLPFAIGFVLLKSGRGLLKSGGWRPAALIAVWSLPMILPWMLKDVIYVHNPIAPFGNSIFRNPNVHISYEQALGEHMRRYDVPDKWTLPLEVTIRGDKTSGVLGPVFLAAPLALLALRERAGRRLLAAGAVLLATYFSNVGTRFLIPCLPFFSLAMLLPLGNSPAWLSAIVLFHAVTSWPAGMRLYSAPSVWSLDRILYREALRIVPQDATLRRYSDDYSLARMIEFNVPRGERVYSTRDVAFSYTTHQVLAGSSSAFSEVLRDILNTGWNVDQQPEVTQTFRFAPSAARRIRLVDISPASASRQWGLHELRFFSHGIELPREPDWRLQAWPNPWDVQLAFDNSLATRWRTWETARPGMYIEAEFSKPEIVDELRIETSREDGAVETAVDIWDTLGNRRIAERPSVATIRINGNIRRAATYELRARRINFLLMNDADYGADDIRGDPESWGLKEIAYGFSSRLYQVIP